MLKAIYQVLENDEFRREVVSVSELAQRRRETLEEVKQQLTDVRKNGFVTTFADSVSFTPTGWQRASEIVRNHRLWELYLTNTAQIPADRVHEDAENIEHVLDEETVRKLEKHLNYARRDLHGKLIPSSQDIWGKGGKRM
jgi:manganese/zinc/iron transport system permease protein